MKSEREKIPTRVIEERKNAIENEKKKRIKTGKERPSWDERDKKRKKKSWSEWEVEDTPRGSSATGSSRWDQATNPGGSQMETETPSFSHWDQTPIAGTPTSFRWDQTPAAGATPTDHWCSRWDSTPQSAQTPSRWDQTPAGTSGVTPSRWDETPAGGITPSVDTPKQGCSNWEETPAAAGECAPFGGPTPVGEIDLATPTPSSPPTYSS